ncbi:MAG: flagellar hook-associated protein FlgK [Magnetococcus sp. DMHC-8]
MSVNNLLNISESGIYAAQNTLQTISHNIANANTPGFSRQAVTLLNAPMGLGVQVKDISRQVDQLLDRRQELGTAETGSLDVKDRFLTQIEQIFNESNGNGLGSRMDALYAAADNLVDSPTNPVNREQYVTSANAVAEHMQKMDHALTGLLTPVDKEVDVLLADVNNRLKALRDVNATIVGSNSTDPSSDLKDQRRQMVLELGKLVNIQTLDIAGGGLQVMMSGGQGLLVDTVHAAVFSRSAGKNAPDPTDPTKETNFAGITLDGRTLTRVQGGKLGGLLEVRDTLINGKNGFATQLDTLANELRFRLNAVSSTGVSQTMYTTLNGVFGLGSGLDTPINTLVTDAHLPTYGGAPVDLSRTQNGEIVLAAGPDTTHVNHIVRIPVTRDMSINDVVSAINSATDQDGTVGVVSASITTDNKLRLQAPVGRVFGVASDSSNMMAALGIGALFGGTGSRDMVVNPAWQEDASRLGVGRMTTLFGDQADPTRITGITFDDGNNQAALAVSQLRETKFTIGGENAPATLTGAYAALVGRLGAVVNQNTESMTAQQAAQDFLATVRQSTSGVSMEEELTDLLRFQRAFQASSKMVSVADQLLQYVVGMV